MGFPHDVQRVFVMNFHILETKGINSRKQLKLIQKDVREREKCMIFDLLQITWFEYFILCVQRKRIWFFMHILKKIHFK